jgi:hypothetical protein
MESINIGLKITLSILVSMSITQNNILDFVINILNWKFLYVEILGTQVITCYKSN